MLLKFKVSNFKNFIDETILDLTPTPKQKDLEESLLEEKVNNKVISALSSSVLYGTNASGKTNIMGALEVFKEIILIGNINDTIKGYENNLAVSSLGLIPNNTLEEFKPVIFEIELILNSELINYKLVLDLGMFSSDESNRKIINEELLINNKSVFIRDYEEVTLNKEYVFDIVHKTNISFLKSAIKQSLKDKELFLTNGFKNIVNNEYVSNLVSWFRFDLLIIYSSNLTNIKKTLAEGNTLELDPLLTDVLKRIGSPTKNIGFRQTGKDLRANLVSIYENQKNNEMRALNPYIYESKGSLKLLNIIYEILYGFSTGKTLLIDEFDCGIHFSHIINIINIYHNNKLNINNAQLIFNTHNPVYLSSSIFRRDEIKFISKDEKNRSVIYSLADFGTSGKDGVRTSTDYMKNYLEGKYGGINDIDFSDIFEYILNM